MKKFLIALIISIPAFFGYQKYKVMNAKTQKEIFFKYDDLFKIYGALNGVPWKWLKAISKQESDLGEDSRVKNGEVSYDGKSYGIMQIAEGIGSAKEIALKGMGGRQALNDPAYSISKAAKLVGYLRMKYHADAYTVFLAYNQGEKNTDRGKNYTDNYPEKILKWLEWINQKEEEYK